MFEIVIILISTIAIAVATENIVIAFIGGQCSNCHTMHDSQEKITQTTGGPLNTLLLDDCIGCHTAANVSTDPLDDSHHTPYIKGAGLDDEHCLAGGFFSDDINDDLHRGRSHTLGCTVEPAGYDRGASPGGDWYNESEGLSCAGASGCHGNQTSSDDMSGIKGGHHNTSSTYRMLYVHNDPVAGIPAADYEEYIITGYGDARAEHNVYSAGTVNGATISEFCAKCHGNFHGNGNTNSSPFTRHPTDHDIPDNWAIQANFYTEYTDIDRVYNPLGFDGLSETAADGQVTCLSCHRAHGTDNTDILRFPYNSQIAGAGDDDSYGCLGCHQQQR